MSGQRLFHNNRQKVFSAHSDSAALGQELCSATTHQPSPGQNLILQLDGSPDRKTLDPVLFGSDGSDRHELRKCCYTVKDRLHQNYARQSLVAFDWLTKSLFTP